MLSWLILYIERRRAKFAIGMAEQRDNLSNQIVGTVGAHDRWNRRKSRNRQKDKQSS